MSSKDNTTSDRTFLESLYVCSCEYECLFKYGCAVVALLFVVVYGTALIRIKKNRTLYLDIRDKLLLSMALA
jgi:hypothetical protein